MLYAAALAAALMLGGHTAIQVKPVQTSRVQFTLEPLARARVIEISRNKLQRGPCGMPIIVANADIDPKIVVPIPEKDKAAAKIRAIEPSHCHAK